MATSTTAAATTTTIAPTLGIGDVVPNVAAFAELLATPVEAQPQIDQLLAAGRHDVAATGPVLSVCATVQLARAADRRRAVGARRPGDLLERADRTCTAGLRRVPQ